MKVRFPTALAVVAAVSTSTVAANQGYAPAANESADNFHVAEQKGQHEMSMADLQNRGKELAAKLQTTYQELSDANELAGGLHGTDITEAVRQYIPTGTPFSDAEIMLRSAGFVIEPHPDLTLPPNPNRAQDWYGVIAEIAPFAKSLIGKTDLYVTLLPISPGDYSTVYKVSATFFISHI